MNEYLDMRIRNRRALEEWAKERGWPAPSFLSIRLFVALVQRHRVSLICEEIDTIIDRLFLLCERIRDAIEDGNLLCAMLLKERQVEEKAKLAGYERLLDREGPVGKTEETTITYSMIIRAKDHPYEDLLPYPLRRNRMRCPIHNGKNPMSFEVKNNYGQCYSCGWHGDTIKFLQDTQGLSFPEAVRRLQ